MRVATAAGRKQLEERHSPKLFTQNGLPVRDLGGDRYEPDGWDPESETTMRAISGTLTPPALVLLAGIQDHVEDGAAIADVFRWASWAKKTMRSAAADQAAPTDHSPGRRISASVAGDPRLAMSAAARITYCPAWLLELILQADGHRPEVYSAALRHHNLSHGQRVEHAQRHRQGWEFVAKAHNAPPDALLELTGHARKPVRVAALHNAGFDDDVLHAAPDDALRDAAGLTTEAAMKFRHRLVLAAPNPEDAANAVRLIAEVSPGALMHFAEQDKVVWAFLGTLPYRHPAAIEVCEHIVRDYAAKAAEGAQVQIPDHVRNRIQALAGNAPDLIRRVLAEDRTARDG